MVLYLACQILVNVKVNYLSIASVTNKILFIVIDGTTVISYKLDVLMPVATINKMLANTSKKYTDSKVLGC